MSSSHPAAKATAPQAPRLIIIAYWLYIAAGVFSLVSLALTLAMANSLRPAVRSALEGAHKSANEAAVGAALNGYLINGAIFAIIWLVLFVVCAIFLRRGSNWARAVLTIVTIFSLVNVFGGFLAGLAQVLAALVASVLVWLKPSSEFFREARDIRRGR
jgi:lysylphosphatidylglycerol synthetase-like protein (DUF2156 family)